LALAEEHVEVIRVARLAQVLKHLFTTIATFKGVNLLAQFIISFNGILQMRRVWYWHFL
jgi:hypothetical protein